MNKPTRRQVLIGLCGLAIVLPFFVTLYLVVTHAVNVPYMDEWETVRLFKHIDAGTLTVGDLWTQHNEHRIFFVNLISITVGSLTHWHLGVQMLLGIFFTLGVLALLCWYARPEIKKKPVLAVTCLVLISALLFSPGQWENWVRGFQLGWFLCVVAGVLALFLLDERTTFFSFKTRYYVAIACCVVSSYSLGSGIFFWPAGFLVLLVTKQTRRVQLGWAAAAVACLALYFYGYTFLKNDHAGATLWHYVQFFFAYLGNVCSYVPEVAVMLGFVLFGLMGATLYYALVIKRVRPSIVALPLGLMLFALLSDAVTTVSRTTVAGAAGATTSKYATVATLLVVGLILLVMQTYQPPKKNSFMAPLLLVIVIAPFLVGVSMHGIAEIKRMQTTLTAVKLCMNVPQPTRQCLGAAHPSPDKVAENLPFLKQHHLAGF